MQPTDTVTTDRPGLPGPGGPEEGRVRIGESARNWREAVSKTVWIGLWLIYLVGPVGVLVSGGYEAGGHHVTLNPLERALGTLGLLFFVGLYLVLVVRIVGRPIPARTLYGIAGLMGGLSVVLSLVLGPDWLVMFIFTSVAGGIVLPWRGARVWVPAVTGVLVLVALRYHGLEDYLPAYALPCLASGFAMVGVQHLIRTTAQLRAAREEVARLAAGEERLRMARDLHDLLGHSLSLITLKSELAGRMLPERPQDAAQQVSDIEQVSRQALVDVREAVTGYRRPQLAVELAGAKAALRAAGITADVAPVPDGLPPRDAESVLSRDAESALAWSVREAVTNVVRHSGAGRCEVRLHREREDGRSYLCLTVLDDGSGPPRAHHEGNGLTGLRERLALADGLLHTGPAAGHRGFALRALVPLPDAAAARGDGPEAAGRT
ncbi:sensor histidine kinase [Streptomyces sp. NPDC059740]|uniref:sensor histidine kinase n=1 Tax=Streptomyces sp. NPDC059740 TaxID=3346926 RepID=UPI00365B8D41